MMRSCPLFAVFLAVVLAVPALAQEEEDLGIATLQSRRMLAEAQELYDSAEFALAIQSLDSLLAHFSELSSATMAVEEEEVRTQAYRLRGLSYYNLGQVEAAEGDFALLLAQQPNLELDRNLLSPKIIAAFERVRLSVTGLLVVSSDPSGAEIRMGGRTLGVTPLEAVRVRIGRYLLDVEKQGYTALREAIEIKAGETAEKNYQLQRNARAVRVLSHPAGADVLVNGQPVGTTSGAAPPGYEVELLEQGLNPAQVSAPLLVPNLAAGRHVIRVEKDCFAAQEATFDVVLEDNDLPLELETIVLTPSRSSLRIQSIPPGAVVTIDEQKVGLSPLLVEDLCGEEVEVRMTRDSVGAWEGTVELLQGQEREVEGELKLTLASLGAVREVGVETPEAESWDIFLAEILGGQDAYATRIPSIEADEIAPSHLELFRHIQGWGNTPENIGDDLRRRLMREVGADLMLVGVPDASGGGVIMLFGAHRNTPDLIPVAGLSSEDAAAVLKLLTQKSLNFTSWSGLVTVETAESDFPYVVSRDFRVDAATTVLPGDRVRSVAGRPVVNRIEMESEFAAYEPGTRVDVSVERGFGLVEAFVVTIETAVFSRPGGQKSLTNKTLADLERLRSMDSESLHGNLAAMGIGLAYLMSGEPAVAMSRGFERCRLPQGGGLSDGTLSYLKGLSLEAMGSRHLGEAESAFAHAAKAEDATLWRDDGPRVAPLAAARADLR